jgi:putative ATPase
MDLFDTAPTTGRPLAERLRPETLADFVGQKHIIGEGKLLNRLIASEQIPSMIFWGPPGVGKTTLARIISRLTRNQFVSLSAVTSNIKEVKEVIEAAKEAKKFNNRQTIVFIDEIHRFNKAQQDAFLPHVENGTITLIGATTENPSFEVIGALLSRSKVLTFQALDDEDLKAIIERALLKSDRSSDFLDEPTKDFLIRNAYGDARYLLNILEDLLAVFADRKSVGFEEAREHVVRRAALYDKNAEHHYNVISAFIKSMRGSDPNAALYYLARMIEGGEEPLFIARRMVIFASEDVGLANPGAIQVAVACMQAFDFVGMPEGWIPLAHCATYLAGSPKSNSSYAGYQAALADVKSLGPLEVPLHLRNAPTKLMKDLGYHKGYKYAHSYEGNVVEQQHLPDAIKDQVYYVPTENGHEKKIKEWLERVKTAKTPE